MTTHDIGKLIYDEACSVYPELFRDYPAAVPDKADYIGGAGLLPPVYGGPDPLPQFLRQAAFLPPCFITPRKPYPPFDVAKIRRDFPILRETVNGKRLVWLDNAA
ncbi:MAG: hypothetical protein GX847_07435, partial [Clostridiales bacterium]|nr:hypothetical protein [Clostridiales bacterium]